MGIRGKGSPIDGIKTASPSARGQIVKTDYRGLVEVKIRNYLEAKKSN